MSRTTVPRRRFLLAGAGGAVGATLFGVRSAAAQSVSTVTLYRLDAAWGTPVLDARGRARTRCAATACHRAAPHRYFLTAADAQAGRLHPGCLAQPVPVPVTIDLNALMPFYRARHGGVDMRCPELPASLRDAIVHGRPAVSPSPPVDPAPAPTPVIAPTVEPSRVAPTEVASTADVTTEVASELAFTGTQSTHRAAVGAALVAGGAAAVALATAARRAEVSDPEG